jgi:hypothetical protein
MSANARRGGEESDAGCAPRWPRARRFIIPDERGDIVEWNWQAEVTFG